jgi:putative transcriptional regulator
MVFLIPLMVVMAGGSIVPNLSAVAADGPIPLPAIGKGVFLVASPQLQDPNFRQTVVLLCEHGSKGTVGIIVNRQTDLLLSEVLPDLTTLKGTSYRLFWGGPVQPTAVLMLFRVVHPPGESRPVMEGVFLGGNPDLLDRLIMHPEPTETFHAYAGYAGWGPGQLEAEMASGAWATVKADSKTVFDKDPAQLWPDLLERLTAPRVLTDSPQATSPPVSDRQTGR